MDILELSTLAFATAIGVLEDANATKKKDVGCQIIEKGIR